MSRAVMFAHMARSSRCSHKTIVNFHCADSLVRFRNRYVERVTLQVPIHGKGQTDSVRLWVTAAACFNQPSFDLHSTDIDSNHSYRRPGWHWYCNSSWVTLSSLLPFVAIRSRSEIAAVLMQERTHCSLTKCSGWLIDSRVILYGIPAFNTFYHGNYSVVTGDLRGEIVIEIVSFTMLERSQYTSWRAGTLMSVNLYHSQIPISHSYGTIRCRNLGTVDIVFTNAPPDLTYHWTLSPSLAQIPATNQLSIDAHEK